MTESNNIQEIFFKFLMQYRFDERHLDYSLIPNHISTLQLLADISNSGIHVFDLNTKQSIFFSSNFGTLLGYSPENYQEMNYSFFESKIHPEESQRLAINGISVLKMFNAFSTDEKLNHKVIDQYRMLTAENKFVRVVEQYQVLELDRTGQIWLLLSIIDISPDQGSTEPVKCQLLNFRTGAIIPFDTTPASGPELTPRELEILKMVKHGYLSKEISDKLSISVHTVNTHRQRVLEKLGANNSFEAIVFASKFGLL